MDIPKNILSAQETFGENFLSLSFYPQYKRSAWVFVLKNIDFETLRPIKKYLKNTRCIFVTKEEIFDEKDVFPLQFLGLKFFAQHKIGEKIFDTLEISQEDIRKKLELDLRTKIIALREEILFLSPQKILPTILPEIFFLLPALFVLRDEKISPDFLTNLKTAEKVWEEDFSVFFEIFEQEKKNSFFTLFFKKKSVILLKRVYTSLENLVKKVNIF